MIIFDADVEKISPREGFGQGLLEAAYENPNIVVVCADLAESTHVEGFKEKFPDRFIEVGVAEQNLVGIASGLAAVGKIPVAVSYAAFSPGRNWEQIRTSICYNNQKVILVGSHAGISVGPDGATHQALEDIALMRVLPNMVVISPADTLEARGAVKESIKYPGPIYIRLPRHKVPTITSEQASFEIGHAQILQEGKDATIIATGIMVYQALLAANELNMHNISVRVINISTIKPLDEQIILSSAEETGAVVTTEDHQAAGGLGSAVAELLSQKFPVPIKIVGIDDVFGESGQPEELLQKYCLSKEKIIQSVITVLKLKKTF